MSNLNWFAVQTWPRYEKKVAGELRSKQISTYLPLVSERHKWSDRSQVVDSPLFSGYIFVSLAEGADGERIGVLRTNGVAGFVGSRGKGTPIPDSEIESVRILMNCGYSFQNCPYLNVGQRVRIRNGSLSGVEGVLVAKNDDLSLVISIEIIQRSLSIRMAGYQVEAA